MRAKLSTTFDGWTDGNRSHFWPETQIWQSLECRVRLQGKRRYLGKQDSVVIQFTAGAHDVVLRQNQLVLEQMIWDRYT